jgi:hypothetical protein
MEQQHIHTVILVGGEHTYRLQIVKVVNNSSESWYEAQLMDEQNIITIEGFTNHDVADCICEAGIFVVSLLRNE